jgi:rod shape-determining protein MreB and related proteins
MTDMSEKTTTKPIKKKKSNGFLGKLFRIFSEDIGIDLGTANTLVYVAGKGIVLNEPSIVAINDKTKQVVAVGSIAKDMQGRTPAHITTVRPLVDGVISDFDIAEEMLTYFIKKAQGGSQALFGPRVVIGVPSGITPVEVSAVRDAATNAGCRHVYIVEEPMAAAIGVGLPTLEPSGSMIVDIGGGTTDIGVISLGGMVNARNLKIAGDRFNQDIVTYVRNEFKILIGDKTAEDVKMLISNAMPGKQALEAPIRGRDLVTGLPRELLLTDSDVREAMHASLEQLLEAIREVLETTPPEVISDVMKRGMVLAGGGALIKNLAPLISNSLEGVPVHVAEDPLTAVVRGCGMMLEDIEIYKDSCIRYETHVTPK